MNRWILTAVTLAILASGTRAADITLGKTVQIELTTGGANGGGSATNGYTFIIPIEQGDKFRFEVSPVGGASLELLHVQVYTAERRCIEGSSIGQKIDWQMTKGAPGKSIEIRVCSQDTGKVNLRVSKVGDPVVSDAKDDAVKKLEAENAALKQQLAEVKQQLADIKKLLEKK